MCNRVWRTRTTPFRATVVRRIPSYFTLPSTGERRHGLALAQTGPADGILTYIFAASVAIGLGSVLLLLNQRRRRGNPLTFISAAFLAACVLGAPLTYPTAAVAATIDCVNSASSLTITQTSALSGLAPDVPAIRITGTVTNDADKSVSVRIITVRILAIRTAPRAPHGSCDASD